MGNLKAFYLFLFFSKSTAGGKLNENTQKLFILTEKYYEYKLWSIWKSSIGFIELLLELKLFLQHYCITPWFSFFSHTM